MRALCLLISMLSLAACEPQPQPVSSAPKHMEKTPERGITISGSARIGVSGRF